MKDPFFLRALGRATDLIVIGCSAGGIETLGEILPALPSGIRHSVVVVIHLAPDTASLLTEVFTPKCQLPVREAEDKEPISPGTIYFAPANYHLLVEPEYVFSLSSEDPVQYSRPSIDLLLESVAFSCGKKAVGIILTGANADGSSGLGMMKEAGSVCIVENPATAIHAEMPRSALAAEPDAMMTAGDIAGWLVALTAAGKGGVG